MNHRKPISDVAPDYVSLVQMTLSESTDYEYNLNLSGYQVKLLAWSLMYLEFHETEIPQLDLPKSMWTNLRSEVTNQVDSAGVSVTPRVESDNHIDVISQIQETSSA